MPLEIRLAYLPVQVIPWLQCTVLLILCVAALMQWWQTRRGFTALFAGAAFLGFASMLFHRMISLAVEGKTFEEMIKVWSSPWISKLTNVFSFSMTLGIGGASVACLWLLVDAYRRRRTLEQASAEAGSVQTS